MHFLIVAVAIVIFASGVLVKSIPNTFNKQNIQTDEINVKTEVLNMVDEKDLDSPQATNQPEPTDENENNGVLVETTSTPTDNNLVYPNSDYVSENKYQTIDDPDTVTNWYKDKIRSLNYNVKNFVSTTVNGVVENKLVGANSETEIEILITKSSGSNVTFISIRP